ncbi:hypothetical protein BJV77DRAFT_139950 [Russula vinacea]|nr:hypothetical protein BJV77DRAFT_139950 [Russula vinacea]
MWLFFGRVCGMVCAVMSWTDGDFPPTHGGQAAMANQPRWGSPAFTLRGKLKFPCYIVAPRHAIMIVRNWARLPVACPFVTTLPGRSA